MTKNVVAKNWSGLLNTWKNGSFWTWPQPANIVGINVNGPLGYASGPLFLNCLKQCGSNSIFSPWFTGVQGGAFDTNEEAYLAPTLDAHGNPTTMTVSGIPGGQQFNKLFAYIYTNMPAIPAGATVNYTAGSYTAMFKVGGSGAASSIEFQLSGDVASLASQTTGVTVSGNTVTSTLAPGSTFTLTFTATGNGGFVITVPVGSGIAPACYFDFASGYIVPTAYLSSYNSGQILHPNFKAQVIGVGDVIGYNGPLRFMTLQKTYQQEWQATFSANLAQNVTSATLTALAREEDTGETSWPWPTGNKNFIFGNGQVISVSGTHAQTTVTLGTALSAAVSTSAIGAMAIATEQLGWANRPKLGDLSWCGPQGIPLEAAIQAGNECGRDVWLCVPASAMIVDGTYLTNFCDLLYDGTGAVLTGSNLSTFTGLNTAQKAWIEYSNEVFNFGSNYKEANLCAIMGVAKGYYTAQGNNQYVASYEYVGTQLYAIGSAFTSKYGAARSSRVAVVCMTQFATGNGTSFMEIAMNTPDAGFSAYTEIDGYGFAPYAPSLDDYSEADVANLVALGTTAGVNKIFSHMWAADPSFPSVGAGGLIGSKLAISQALLSSWNTQPWASKLIVGYEASSALDDAHNYEPSVPGWRALLAAVQTDPRFAYVFYDPTHQLSTNDGYLPGLQDQGFSFVCPLSDVSKLMVAGDPAGSGNWGACQSYMQTISPLSSAPSKAQGIWTWINS